MRAEVLRHTLRFSRRATAWWIAGIAVFLVVTVATYPAVEGQTGYDDLVDDMPDALLALFGIERGLSLTSPEGFLVSQAFGFVLPLLFAILGVAFGARAIAGDEEQHSLELLLAQPVSRIRVAVEKFVAVAAVTAVVAAATWIVLVATCPIFGLDAGVGDMAAAVAVAGFVLESLAELTTVLARLRWLSPFHFVNGNVPMLNGLRAVDVAVLLALAVGAAAAGTVAFDRRDLRP